MPLIFQYGSNTDAERLNGPGRLNGAAQDRGLAETVDEYEIAFDIWSYSNGCAASNLIAATGTGHRAWGVLFEVPEDRIYGRRRPDGLRTMEEIEGGRYEPKPIRVRDGNGNEIPGPVTTFLVNRINAVTASGRVSNTSITLSADSAPMESRRSTCNASSTWRFGPMRRPPTPYLLRNKTD
jgi:hypothetical protein